MKCKYCSKEIADGLEKCPECGKKLAEKKNSKLKFIIPAAVLIVVAVIIFAVFATKSHGKENIDLTTNTTDEVTEKATGKKDGENQTQDNKMQTAYKEEKIDGNFGPVVFTVDGEDIYEAEYHYYYSTMIYELMYYVQNYASYGLEGLNLDTSKELQEQEYDGFFGDIPYFPKDKKATWADYISYSAKDRIINDKALIKQAQKDGFSLSEDNKEEAEYNIWILEQSLLSSSSSETENFEDTLKKRYGEHMTQPLAKQLLTRQKFVTAYQEYKSDEMKNKISDKAAEEEFESNISKCGTVSFRWYGVAAGSSQDGKTADMESAKKTAEKIAKAKNEKEFLTLISQNEKANGNEEYKDYLNNDSLTLMSEADYYTIPGSADEKFGKWIFGKNTAANSTYIAEDEGYGYVVYMMLEPVHKAKEVESFDIRLIHIPFTSSDTDNSANDFDFEKYGIEANFITSEAKNKTACNTMTQALSQYLETDRSQWSFAKTAYEKSQDSQKSSGGLYTNVIKGYLGDEFDSFCFDKNRKTGDIKVIETSNDSYKAYQIIYFLKARTVTWQDKVKDEMVTEQYKQFLENLKADVKASDLEQSVVDSIYKSMTSSDTQETSSAG